MKKILISLATLGVVGAIVTGGTTAIFSDEETSTGNTFTAGAIDLTIDNESYYNGVLNASTTWLEPADLDDGNGPSGNGAYLFFSFDDLKPGDWGEDTISIHVDNNDSWLCADVTLTSNDDNGINEPEAEDGDVTDGAGQGELADGVTFIWWADDGDNVLESDENVLNTGTLGQLGVGNTATVPLADSTTNIWEGSGPLQGDSVRYVGKAWCFGDMTLAPVTQDGSGTTTDPTVDPGFTCNGAPVDNVTQSDSMTADIGFRAVQSRNNDDYLCEVPDTNTATGTLTVTKSVVGTSTDPGDFDLFVGGDQVTSGESNDFEVGDYVVSETQDARYETVIGGNCDASGNITVTEGGTHSCSVTNTWNPVSITVDKIVSFSSTTLNVNPGDFDLFIDDGVNGQIQLTDGIAMDDLPAGTYTVSETYTGGENISVDAQYTGDCSDNGDTGTIVIANGGSATCIITNVISEGPVT